MENEVRLIDGNALRRKVADILRRYDTPETFGEKLAVYSVFDEVVSSPTIAPESLRPKGRWKSLGCGEFVCGRCWSHVEYESRKCGHNYCPNCGAKMEG